MLCSTAVRCNMCSRKECCRVQAQISLKTHPEPTPIRLLPYVYLLDFQTIAGGTLHQLKAPLESTYEVLYQTRGRRKSERQRV